MPDGVFRVLVLTPEEQLLDTDARALVLRSSTGELTILDGHTPIITDAVPGDVRVDRTEGDPVHLAVHGGYLQVETGVGVLSDGGVEGRSTRATLLAGVAELADRIDVDRAERAREAAAARVEELRAAVGRSGAPSAPQPGAGGDHGAGGGAGGLGGAEHTTPEELELAEAEAALRRAEVRLEVAGARA